MAKNRSIHDLIEEQEPESKRRMKKKLDQYFTDDDLFDTEVAAKKPFQWKKFTSIAVAFILVIGIALFSVFYFQPKGPKSRYYTQEEYTIEERTEKKKKKDARLKKKCQYLDWYDFELIKNNCNFSTTIKKQNIQYAENNLVATAYFEYEKNVYYLKLQQPSYVTILDIVEEMLP